MGSTTGTTPPPPRADSSLGSAIPVPTGSNLVNPEQPKPGSATLATATLGDRPRSSNVADLVRTFEKGSAKGNIKTPVQRSEAKAGQPEAQSARRKAPEFSTKRTRIPGSTPDDTLVG
ncbi:hypothetical protein JTB14_031230 [Gonioctena quinquepunctata]|nr:hypothetical protein JTB14_031230 [Gonioctena quinquepunctata]